MRLLYRSNNSRFVESRSSLWRCYILCNIISADGSFSIYHAVGVYGLEGCRRLLDFDIRAAVIFGVILDKMGGAKEVKNVRIKGGGHEENEGAPKGLKEKLKLSFWKAWGDFKGVFIYMVIGVAIGAVIYGYLPEDLLAGVAGPDNPFAVFVVALISMPLYIRVESAIPIGLALLDKGASMGAVMALIISGAGIAIPELTMLSSIKPCAKSPHNRPPRKYRECRFPSSGLLSKRL